MEIKKRKTIFDNFKKFDPGAKEEDFIEVTEWTNGDGVDIVISYYGHEKNISLHYDEIEAIKYLELVLRYEKGEE